MKSVDSAGFADSGRTVDVEMLGTGHTDTGPAPVEEAAATGDDGNLLGSPSC